jgi:hypothetical protein
MGAAYNVWAAWIAPNRDTGSGRCGAVATLVDMALANRAVVVIVLVLGAIGGACATATPEPALAQLTLEPLDLADGAPPADLLPARLPAPDTAADAQMFLQGSVAALRAHEPAHAALFLDAILRSDHLTDRGRANVYWLLGEARRQLGDDARLADAMSGFLVAATLVHEDDDFLDRQARARVTLAATRLRMSPALGTSPTQPIRVDREGDVGELVGTLGCGPQRTMPYVEQGKHRAHDARRTLEARTLTCTDDGTTVTLWFDVTTSE